MMVVSSSKRDQLVETALELFEAQGFRAVGIDRILDEASIAKMTLYKHFPTKDDLAAAALELKDRRYRVWFNDELARREPDPRRRLREVFGLLQEVVDEPGFPGCVFARAAAEYRAPEHPVRRAAVKHKEWIHQALTQMAADAGAGDPPRLALQLTALMDGVMAHRQAEDCGALCPAVREAADVLIDAAL